MQTAARGAVCVFAGCVRSSQEGGSKSVLADNTVARGGSSKRQVNSSTLELSAGSVLEGIKMSILSVGVLAKRSVCLEGIKVTFLVVL